MIEHIQGKIDRLTPTDVVIDINGLGYILAISLSTFSKIEKLTDTRLLVHEVIREDTHDLFGFADEQERTLFRLLIGVSGVGPNTARMILSSLSAQQLEQCITAGDHSRLKAVKGIGLKTAQRIIVDLKDKIATSGMETVSSEMFANPANTEIHDEAVAALTMLGFAQAASQKVVAAILKEEPAAPVEKVIKLALKRL